VVTEEEEGEAARWGGVGGWGCRRGVGALDGDSWIGGGGKRIQQGWRALDGGVLGVLLVF